MKAKKAIDKAVAVSPDEDLAFSGDIMNYDAREVIVDKILTELNAKLEAYWARRRPPRHASLFTRVQSPEKALVRVSSTPELAEYREEDLLPFEFTRSVTTLSSHWIVYGVVLPDKRIYAYMDSEVSESLGDLFYTVEDLVGWVDP